MPEVLRRLVTGLDHVEWGGGGPDGHITSRYRSFRVDGHERLSAHLGGWSTQTRSSAAR
jgi:hypothetical protein